MAYGAGRRGIKRQTAVALAALGLALAASPSVAEAAPVAVEAADLKPGEFSWDEAAAADGPVLIAVSIADQKLYAYRGGALLAVSTVSTGKRGHRTPAGAFPILEKRRAHFSNLYNNAPMPFMQRLTWDGIALHAGALPGYPASHGCIRLPLAFAERLFAVTSRGGVVVVVDGSLTDPLTGVAPALAPFDATTGAPVPSPEAAPAPETPQPLIATVTASVLGFRTPPLWPAVR